MINKNGSLLGVIGIIGGAMLLICFIFMFIIGGAIIKESYGDISSEIRDIGVIYEDVNVSETADYVLTPADTLINNYTLYATILYILGIVAIFVIALTFRGNISPPVIALFVAGALLLVVFSILISNGYEGFYSGNDFIGDELREAGAINYLILYSPEIMTIVVFIAGIIMMTGKRDFQ